MLERMTNNFWSRPLERVLHEYGTDPVRGLTSTEAKRRLQQHGPNQLKGNNGPSLLAIYLRQYKSPLLYILLFAAAFSAVQRDWEEVVVILLVVLINSMIGFLQERKAEQAMSRLRLILSPKARVIRNGTEQKIEAAQVVVGDIIKIEAGDRIPADARIIQSQGLRVNQAALTGESIPAHKKTGVVGAEVALIDRTNMLWMSTLVVTGQGVAVVTATGMRTELGTIAREVSEVKDLPENLQRQLLQLGRWLLVIAIIASGLSFVVGALSGISAAEMLKVAISLLVSVVPEGLPIAVTVTLSVGLLRVYRRGAVIRKLAATETLGSTTTICVDKTGTLTEGLMMVERVYTLGQEVEVTGDGYKLSGDFLVEKKRIDPHRAPALKALLQFASLATMSTINEKDLKKDEATALTDPTETALAVVAAKAGYYAFAQERTNPEVLDIPFDQELRYSTSVHEFGRNYRYIVKGAPEKILALSSSVVSAGGKVTRLLGATRSALEEYAHGLAAQGYRVTALGYVDYPKRVPVRASQVKNLTFVGYFAMTDPIRKEVAGAIEKAASAGIRVIMITGDHLLTAESIGKRLGLLRDGLKAVHADEIHRQDMSSIGVIARATPSQKLQMIERLQRRGQIVAMTGDGVNDAPALKKADIGIAMGRGGTDVAIETSDMVLVQDSFVSIVAAIEQGRIIWENLKKAVFLTVSTSLAAVALIIATLLYELPLPLIAVQILWLNLVTDGITAMALTVEPAERNVMKLPPRSPKERFIGTADLIRMLLLSVTMTIVAIAFYRFSLPYGVEYARSVTLTVMVFMQLANVFNSRSATQSIFSIPFFSNRLLLVMVLTSATVHLLALSNSLVGGLLGMTPLEPAALLVLAIASLVIILVDELRKFSLLLLQNWARVYTAAEERAAK